MPLEALIVSAARTPIGKFQGSLKDMSAPALGAHAIRIALERAGLNGDQLDEVIFGNVLQAGIGQNPARQAALRADIPQSVPSFTVNKVCGSGLKAVALAAQSIRSGDAEIVVAGGTENMTRAPYLLPNGRSGVRLGSAKILDSLVSDGLTCAMNDIHMGVTAENIATKFAISRAEQDEFALASQRKAAQAQANGYFSDEIAPVALAGRSRETIFSADEFIRADADLNGLSKLAPAFQKNGTVTAGNASGINDGAAALALISSDRARLSEATPLAIVRSYATAGVDPAYMGLGPIPAIHKALDRAQLSLSQMDAIELNEAFAAQSIGVLKELGLENDARVNPLGGAIALGHPIGASGARILVTLLHHLRRNRLRFGLAALCIGGGQGVALIVERI